MLKCKTKVYPKDAKCNALWYKEVQSVYNFYMKKFIALALVCFSLLLNQSPSSLSSISAFSEGTHTFYTMQNFKDERVEVVQSGRGFLISCPGQIASEIFAELDEHMLQGESFTFKGELQDVQSLLFQLNVVQYKKEDLGGIYIVYGYTPLFQGGVQVEDQKINIQLAFRDQNITVGTPLILGSY